MTITDILNFANKYNLSNKARDELIKMIVLNQTNSNLKLGQSNNIIQKSLLQEKTPSIKNSTERITSHGCSNDRLAGTLYLKDRNIIDKDSRLTPIIRRD